jgi:hypothetical protein
MPISAEHQTGSISVTLDLDSEPGAAQGIKELTTDLAQPTTRLSVAVRGGSLGRAEALVGKHNWAAAHYWTEPAAESESHTVTFEWSETLPAGPLRLRLPYRRGSLD